MIRAILYLTCSFSLVSCNKTKQAQSSISDSDFRNAVRNGELALTNEYIGKGYNIHKLGAGGENALHEGVLDFDVAKLLIDKGINVNQKHKYDGSTPLIVSCISSNIEARTVKLLLDSGAAKNIKDIHGKTALDYAKESYTEEDKDLYEYDEKIDLLENKNAEQGSAHQSTTALL